MIVVRVELWSAITGKKSELARMMIANEGGTDQLGDYSGRTYMGRDEKALTKSMLKDTVSRRGEVKRHPRWREHIWNLVAKMLNDMGYGK